MRLNPPSRSHHLTTQITRKEFTPTTEMTRDTVISVIFFPIILSPSPISHGEATINNAAQTNVKPGALEFAE